MKKTLIVFFLGLSQIGFSQSKTYKEEAPMGAVYSSECAPEPVAVSGSLITRIHQVFNDNKGTVEFKTDEGENTVGIGMNTGIQYKVKVNEFVRFFFDGSLMTDFGFQQKFTLQGPGPNNDYSIKYSFRASYNSETAQFQTKFEKLEIQCK